MKDILLALYLCIIAYVAYMIVVIAFIDPNRSFPLVPKNRKTSSRVGRCFLLLSIVSAIGLALSLYI